MPKYELEKRTNVWYNKNIQFGRKKGYKVERDNRIYIAIDLKSFYASVECVERGLDPLTTNLVVADAERTQKTICLAVSPSLKEYGIPGRARLFEVIEKVKEVNCARRMRAPGGIFQGESERCSGTVSFSKAFSYVYNCNSENGLLYGIQYKNL